MPRIICPTCGAALDVTPDMIGETVECGGCHAHFVAQTGKSPSRRAADDEDRPSRRRPRDEDDRPSRRRRSDEEENDPPSRRRRDEDDDEDDYRPRRRRRASSDSGTGMATASLVLGILSLPLAFCCGLFSLPISVLEIIFGVLGMKTEGRGMATTGLVLSGSGIVMTIIMVVLGLAVNLAKIGGGNNFKPRPNNPPWNQPPPAPQPPPRFR